MAELTADEKLQAAAQNESEITGQSVEEILARVEKECDAILAKHKMPKGIKPEDDPNLGPGVKEFRDKIK